MQDEIEAILEDLRRMIEVSRDKKMTGNVAIRINLMQGGITNYNKFAEESCRVKKN